jgi:penicillin-binding protein 1A
MIKRLVRLFLPNLTLKSFLKFVVLFTFAFSLVFAIFFGVLIATVYDPVKVKNLRYLAIPEPMKIYDQNGKLISELFIERRKPVSYNEISKNLVMAFVAVEDEDFFYHRGISIQRIIKAFIKNLLAGKVREGASTITQQLAKRVFTTGERSIFRKIVEAWYALQIEREYSKEEIMEIYLNQIYFGFGAYGVEMASHVYFGKSAKDLTVPEAALIAAIAKGPNFYSPFVNIENAKKRHYLVLKRMASLGVIPEDKVDEYYSEFWDSYILKLPELKLRVAEITSVNAPFFTEYVRSTVAKLFGDEAVYKSGFKVYTTLDLDKQLIAEKYLRKYRDYAQSLYDANWAQSTKAYVGYVDLLGLVSQVVPILEVRTSSALYRIKENVKFSYYALSLVSELLGSEAVRANSYDEFLKFSIVEKSKNRIECALVSVNSKNGYIEAMIGGSEFSSINRFNRAIQAKRQLGSAFKPFLYSAGIDARLITAATPFVDEPIEYTYQGTVWSPKNYEGSYQGLTTVRDALKLSLNVVSVKILERIGLGVLRSYVAKFFDLSPSEVNLYINSMASALGTLEVSPLDLAAAFTVFPRMGTRIDPIAILRIEDKYGRVIKDFLAEGGPRVSQQVISPQTAFIVSSMMKDVVNHGTGISIRRVGFTGECAGKTGTTSYWRDAWFAGFTTDGLVTVVWFGFDQSSVSMGRGMVGGAIAAPVFGEYMRDYYKGKEKYLPPLELNMPSGITSVDVCTESGKLATPFCPNVRREYFIVGTEPTEKCDIHSSGKSQNVEEIIKELEKSRSKEEVPYFDNSSKDFLNF